MDPEDLKVGVPWLLSISEEFACWPLLFCCVHMAVPWSDNAVDRMSGALASGRGCFEGQESEHHDP